jgi:hypothetical protein
VKELRSFFKRKIILNTFAMSLISVYLSVILFPKIFKQYNNQISNRFIGLMMVGVLLMGIAIGICTSILCIFLKDYERGEIQVSKIRYGFKRFLVFLACCIISSILISIFYGLLSQVVYSLAHRELHIDIIKNIISIITNIITLCFIPSFILLFFSYMVEEKNIKESLFQIVKGGFRKYFKILLSCVFLFLFGYITGLGIQNIEIQALAVGLHMLILVILGTISIPMFAAVCIKIKKGVN